LGPTRVHRHLPTSVEEDGVLEEGAPMSEVRRHAAIIGQYATITASYRLNPIPSHPSRPNSFFGEVPLDEAYFTYGGKFPQHYWRRENPDFADHDIAWAEQ
jgi:hypothetical protein